MSKAASNSANPSIERFLIALIVLSTVVLSYGIYDAVRDKTVFEGDRAPGFRVATNTGATITQTSFGGELLLVNFWATWCPPCVEEMPSLEQFHAKFRDRGVVVLGVNVDRSEQTYLRFVQQSGITFPNTYDPSAGISASFGTFKFPETYLINREGRVLEKFVGPETWTSPEVVQRIERHLPRG
ncbi:MAG: TlpA disulfide reductase family protein [Bryobacterales bacterium]|nr:TlpA disulfide reductase family protein [Bryobacterales bacterium]